MPKKKPQPKNPFVGAWRIVSMSAWDYSTLTEDFVPGIEFDGRGAGQFQFLSVEAFLDCRLTTRDGLPAIEWSWEGHDEMEPVHGRGWAMLDGKELRGMIYFHQGDDTEFVAKPVKQR